MSELLRGRTAIVTGAAQGLGAAIARRFAAEGARLALVDYNAAGLDEVAAQCGQNAIAIEADLSDAEDTRAAIAKIAGQVGTVDTLIHNAAILIEKPFVDEDFAGFSRTLNVGLQAGFQLAHSLWPSMAANGGGALVFVSSRSGIQGFAGESAYCAAKHGLEGLSKSLAMEGEPHGITSNTVTPGMYMHTPMSERNYSPELKAKWVDPAMLTSAFVWLARRHDSSKSGQRLDAWALSQEINAA
jgi:NAD(P)-dependent dehydrogenase (short-subunit alcohol dehydrogenase family)